MSLLKLEFFSCAPDYKIKRKGKKLPGATPNHKRLFIRIIFVIFFIYIGLIRLFICVGLNFLYIKKYSSIANVIF